MKSALHGYVPILATPFDAGQDVDVASLRRLIDHLVDCGTDGLVTLANASEGYLLSAEERRQVADAVLERVAGRVPVVVSITIVTPVPVPVAEIVARRRRRYHKHSCVDEAALAKIKFAFFTAAVSGDDVKSFVFPDRGIAAHALIGDGNSAIETAARD